MKNKVNISNKNLQHILNIKSYTLIYLVAIKYHLRSKTNIDFFLEEVK